MRLVVLPEGKFVELSRKVLHDNQSHSDLIVGRHLVFYAQDIIVLCEPDFRLISMQDYPDPISIAELVRYAHRY